MYEKGEGCLKDSFENLYWYSRTAKNGNLEAQLFLGDFYINGIELSKNFALAFEFFYLASENGNPKAQCSIGIIYELGLGGVQQNSQKAFEYYKKSAEQNYEKAKEKLDLLSPKKSNIKSNSFFRLAYTYYCMGGNKKNLNIAFKYFYKASLMGNCEAQFYLGDMYESGEGTEKDDLEAIYWYFKSSQNGNKESENKFKVLSSMKDGIPSSVWEYYRFFEKKKLADRGDANAQFEIAQKYRTGDGVQKDYKKAFYWCELSAKNGNYGACNDLGLMYNNNKGNFCKKDYKQALYWLNKAFTEGKNSIKYQAESNLAIMYEFGQGIEQDYKKAFELYKESAENGDSFAQCRLGIMFEEGRGIEKDYEKAMYWYKKAAEQNDPEGQCFIADLYKDGIGVKQDYKKALEWYKKSAEQNYSTAQVQIGIIYEAGWGVKKDYKKAMYWYKKSADNGNNIAQQSMGYLYKHSRGCKKSIAKAIKCFKEAIKNGNNYPYVDIGDIYREGKDIKQDYEKAIYWYKKGINCQDEDSKYAQFSLGYMYEKGLGTKKDYKKAFELYQQSAIQGHKKAQYRLGYLYEKGKGTEKNLEKALEWYKKSAEQNYKRAQNAYERVSKKRV